MGMAVASGGEMQTVEEDYRSGVPIVKLQPDFNAIKAWSKMFSKLYCHHIKQRTFYVNPIRSSGSTEGSLEEAGRSEHHIITEAAASELKLGTGA